MQQKFGASALQIRGKILAMNSREIDEDLDQDFMRNEKIIDATPQLSFSLTILKILSQFSNYPNSAIYSLAEIYLQTWCKQSVNTFVNMVKTCL